MHDSIPQSILDTPGFKCLAITTPHDREKANFVLGLIRTTVMEKLKLDDFHASVSNVIYNQILSTSNDVEGVLLQDNSGLQDELRVISQQVIDEVLRIEQGMSDGTIQCKKVTEEIL